MFKAVSSPYLVPFDGTFRIDSAPTKPAGKVDEKDCKKQLKKTIKALGELQNTLYADDNKAVLLVFQAMDAAGKDSTIRKVLSGINPAGCQVFSFKQPSKEELDHDFLWRSACRLPERGRIGVFNRSYYEDVLVVRVHPEYLNPQQMGDNKEVHTLWPQRYESILDHEKHLARSGTAVIKFWLNISKDEQKNRFLSRLTEPEKHWKFSAADLKERALWPKYMEAYNDALNATSRPWAPWYAIPADNKPFMRTTVAEIILQTLTAMKLRYPKVRAADKRRFTSLVTKLKQQ